MDAFVRNALSTQAGVPLNVARDPFFQPSHGSQLFNSLSGNSSSLAADPAKLYDWDSSVSDGALMKKLREMYSLESSDTQRCLFTWQVRQALGQYFVPTLNPSEGLLSRSGSNSNTNRRDVLARMIVEHARALASENQVAYGFLEPWGANIIAKGQLELLFREMEVKQSREGDIYRRHKQFTLKPPTSSATLYTATPAPAAAMPPPPVSAAAITTTAPPTMSLPERQQTTFNPNLAGVGGVLRDHQEGESDTTVRYRMLDEQMRLLTREGERLDALEQAIEGEDHKRYYNTLSLRMFAYGMIIMWLISIPFSVFCLDGWALFGMGVIVCTLGTWAIMLASLIRNYWSIDAFSLVATLASFLGFVYLLLRTFVYNFGGCSAQEVQVFLLWLSWLFLVCLTVFAITLSNARNVVRSWNLFRKRPTQKPSLKTN